MLLLLAVLVQSPADRASIESLRDSLALVQDTVALAQLEASTIQLAKQRRDDPVVHLRLGVLAYRLAEITKTKSHYDDAAGGFGGGPQLRPRLPYSRDGVGPSELALGAA